MEIGAAIFFTDYSMAPTKLAAALEERGFDSLWVAEHSHIPVTRRYTHPLGEAALTKEYFDVMDPFVTVSAAAAVTTRLKLATAICLVIQRDTIQTAKAVASLDQISKGRFLFGIGCGWNAEEMEDHGTVHETRTTKMREQIEAMKEIWTKDRSEFHGEVVSFPPMMTWPKPVQKPHPPIIVGGAFRLAARRAIRYGDGLLPAAPSAGSGSPEDFMAAPAADGGRSWTRPAIAVGDVGRRAREHRCIEAQPRSRRDPHDRAPAAGQGRRDPADPRSLGEADSASERLKGGTKRLTKPAHTAPPPDAAARRRAPPVLTYSVEQLPSFDAAFYDGARAELSKVAEVAVPPREAKAFEVAGHFFRIVSVEGPQVGDLNLWNAHDLTERFYSGKTRALHATHLTTGDRLW